MVCPYRGSGAVPRTSDGLPNKPFDECACRLFSLILSDAVSLLHNEECIRILVQLAYAIGVEHPVSYRIVDQDTKTEYGLGDYGLEDLTPKAIQDRFGLLKPIYLETARRGHFGNETYTKNGIEYYAWDYKK